MTPDSLMRAAFGVVVVGGGAMLGGMLIDLVISPDKVAVTPDSSIEAIAPESATEATDKAVDQVYGREFMMVAAHPVASHVGAAVLDEGGSAVDAIIAAQMVLNLVEPQSSGIGGGGFLLVWDRERRSVVSYDGRETAPAGGSADYLRAADGGFRPFFEALTGGASVGVPGLLRMFELAHRNHGLAEWGDLFTPAIALATKGFPISPRLNGLLRRAQFLADMAPANVYFYQSDGETPFPIGHVLKNPDFAATLTQIAEGGADAFYTGPLAEAIVAAVQNAARNPGALSLADMAGYQALERPAACLGYRDHSVCGMGPPSSGGVTVAQILGLVERAPRDIRTMSPLSVEATQVFAEAMRLAFADRNRYLADSDFVDVPVAGLLEDDYLEDRAEEMDFGSATKERRLPGMPDMDEARRPLLSDDLSELPATTHLVAVDRRGTVASLTSSIETGFGSRLMVGGFLLNNQLTDFAWRAEVEGAPVANRYEPGKRPRSSMAPTIVLDAEGTPRLAIGSPGGSRIIGYVAKTIVGHLDWDLSLQEAITLPHFLSNNGPLDLEDRPALDALARDMAARGYEVKRRAMTSGLHGIALYEEVMAGGADPRREGMAVSEASVTRDLDAVFYALIGAPH